MVLTGEIEPPYTEADILARARQDGIHDLPGLDQAGYAAFEEELLRAHECCASRVVETCHRILEKIDAALKEQHHAATAGHATDLEKVEGDYRSELARENDNPILRHAMEDFEEADRAFKTMYARLNRMPISSIPLWFYVLLAVAIGIGEVPLNAIVFNIFGENQVMTWVMSLIIGLTIPLTAHFVGLKIREHGEGFSLPNAVKALVVSAVMIGALFVLALMRQDYIHDVVGPEIGLTERVMEASFLFFWLNLAVFTAATLASYLAHDPVAGFAQRYADKERTQKQLKKAQDAHARAIQAIEQRRSERIHAANNKRHDAETQVARLEGEYDSTLRGAQQEEAQWLHRLGQSIASYRGENLRHRTDKKTPACFANKIEFPPQLAGLPEKTTNGTPNPRAWYGNPQSPLDMPEKTTKRKHDPNPS